jgi:hypothetical protein
LPVPNVPGLPPSPQTPLAWFAWRDQVLAHRIQVTYETTLPGKAGQIARAREIALCARSKTYLIAVYGSIYEARPDEDAADERRPIIAPYVPYPFQLEVLAELDDAMRSKGAAGDTIFIKARDMGLSNTVAFWAGASWLVTTPFQARVLSREERLVDQTGDPDSFFWKIETFLMGLPEWLLQHFAPGFDWKRHRLMLRFINPANMNLISGESTQADAGRGGRASVIIYDEMCFMAKLGAIWTAGRASTRHRVGISTVSLDQGMDCFNIVHGEGGYEQPRVIMIPWTEHPEHDAEWLARERARDTEEGIRREVLMDWHAGSGAWIYPETHDYEPGDYPMDLLGGDFYVAIDDGWDDDWAMVLIEVMNNGRPRVLTSYSNSHQPADFYGSLLRAKPDSRFTYGAKELDFMATMRLVPGFTAVGDPHMKHTNSETGSSIHQRLWEKWNIVVLYDPQNRTDHKSRREATGALLPLVDFATDPGAAAVLTALQRTRMREKPEGSESATEQTAPIHSKYSHLVSAFEYFALQFDIFRLVGKSGNKIKYVGQRGR